MSKAFFILLSFFFCFSSCYKGHLYVQKERLNKNFLASTFTKTPDPLQENFSFSERLVIGWDFPRSWFQKGLELCITVRFWDNTQENFFRPILRKRGYDALFFCDETPCHTKRIVTYKVQVFDEKREEVLETWQHHFWTEWIDLDREKGPIPLAEPLSEKEKKSQKIPSAIAEKPKKKFLPKIR